MVVECKREKEHVQAHCCSKQKYLQSSRLVDLRMVLAGSFLVLGAVLCTGGCLPAPLTPIQQTPVDLPTPVVTTRNVSGLGRVSPGGLCRGMRNAAVKLHHRRNPCLSPPAELRAHTAHAHCTLHVHTAHTHAHCTPHAHTAHAHCTPHAHTARAYCTRTLHTLCLLSFWIFCTELLLNIRICTIIFFFLLVYLNASKFIQLGSSCP